MVSQVTIAIDGVVPAWDQWFFDGFSVSQPLVTMFFNGCQPLVQQCDGNDTSLRSIPESSTTNIFPLLCLPCPSENIAIPGRPVQYIDNDCQYIDTFEKYRYRHGHF